MERPDRILIVEDSKTFAGLLDKMIHRIYGEQFTVDTAVHYDAAVEKLAEHEYSVLLVDYYLKDYSGLDISDYCQKKNIKAPIIFLTTFIQEDMNERALKAGVYDFIDKSTINKDVLKKSISYSTEVYKNVQLQTERDKLQLIQELAGGIAHEIAQPVQTIYNYVDLIRMNHDVEATLDRLEAELMRVRKLIKKLQNVTKFQSVPYVGREQILNLESDPEGE